MKIQYIYAGTSETNRPLYFKRYKKHFFNRYKYVISPTTHKKQLYTIINNQYIAL